MTGLVTRPISGAQDEGAKGFFKVFKSKDLVSAICFFILFEKGVGQALSGVVVKPIAGTFGMVSRITEGVKNSANRAQVVARVRLPRFIGKNFLS